uniref:HCO3_cotransp domain-containing protein n=1 Tax=Ascaris lumbricoides TaxID=6252 RepID=A0A0M3IGN7_ASCLU
MFVLVVFYEGNFVLRCKHFDKKKISGDVFGVLVSDLNSLIRFPKCCSCLSLVVFTWNDVMARAQFPVSEWYPKTIGAHTSIMSVVHRTTLVTGGLVLVVNFSDIILHKGRWFFSILFFILVTVTLSVFKELVYKLLVVFLLRVESMGYKFFDLFLVVLILLVLLFPLTDFSGIIIRKGCVLIPFLFNLFALGSILSYKTRGMEAYDQGCMQQMVYFKGAVFGSP